MFTKRCHLRCLASRRASIVLVFYCLQVVVVALIGDWDGLPVWCDIYWFFHGWRRLRNWRRILYIEYECIRISLTLYNPQYSYQSTWCMLSYIGADIDSQTYKYLESCKFWVFNWGVAEDSIILRYDTASLDSLSHCDKDTTLFRGVGNRIPSDAVSYVRRRLSSS